MTTKEKEYHKEYRVKNKERQKEYIKRWKSENGDKVKLNKRVSHFKQTYGITLDDYNEMFLKQNGCCAICNKPHTEYKRNLHVDHNHSTGKNRGLLCVRCNYGLGYFGENLELLDRAKEYLTKYSV